MYSQIKPYTFPRGRVCLVKTSLLLISKTEVDGAMEMEMDAQQKYFLIA